MSNNMGNNDDLILRGKALKDLRGIQDVLMSQGDPFLAGVINRAIKCIENQPAAPALIMEPVRAPQWIAVKECPCDGCKGMNNTGTCGHPSKCVKFALWLNGKARETDGQ